MTTTSPTRPVVGGALAPRRVPVVLLCGVYVVALGGRFTLDRIGVPELGQLDLRLPGAAAVVLGVLFWRLHPDAREHHVLAPSIRWALALFGLLALTAAWSPPGADVAEALTDIGVLAVLVVSTTTLTAPDPARGARVLLALALGSGLLYAALGLLSGATDVQGRTAVLGGGPNVYVRVVCLGLVAAIAYAVMWRSWLLTLVPVLGVAAVLSGSRGGIAAALVTALFFLVVFRRRWSPRWLGGLCAASVVGALLALLTVGSRIRELVDDRVVTELSGRATYSGRPELLDRAAALFAEHPLLGGGLDSFWARYGRSVDLGYPHNLVAEVAVTAGLAGLGVLAAFLVRLVSDARARSPLATEQIALVVGAVYVLVESMFSGDLYDSRFFWIFAVAAVNLRSSPPPAVCPLGPRPPVGGPG